MISTPESKKKKQSKRQNDRNGAGVPIDRDSSARKSSRAYRRRRLIIIVIKVGRDRAFPSLRLAHTGVYKLFFYDR